MFIFFGELNYYCISCLVIIGFPSNLPVCASLDIQSNLDKLERTTKIILFTNENHFNFTQF